jgi:predicted MPP superfamily phosphohydrolase
MHRWYIFLTIILCIYSALHLYLLIKVRRAYYLESWNYFLIVVILLFLMTAPMQARALESQNYHLLALIMTWIGFIWMGGVFIWLWLALIMDAYHISIMVLQRLMCTDLIHLLLSRRQGLYLTLMITLGLMIYGVYSAQNIRTEQKIIISKKIPPASDGLRIVQLSDLHLGQIIVPGRLDHIIKAINSANPDIVVSTGDLMDGPIYDEKSVMQKLQAIRAKSGKFAVTGNHESYAGMEYATIFTETSGFKLLRNDKIHVTDHITIVGVDDPAAIKPDAPGESELLSTIPAKRYTILLKHQPKINNASIGHIDLQLSGHTHGGQIFPFNLVVQWAYPLFSGIYPIPQGGQIYVSPGAGTWGPPIRLGAPSQITVFDLRPHQKAAPPPKPTPKNKG